MNNYSLAYMSESFERKKNTRAFLITVGVAASMFLIFIVVKQPIPTIPDPLEEIAVEVNLGDSDFGLGEDQPLLPGKPAEAQQIAYNPPQPVQSDDHANVKDVLTDDRNQDAAEIKKPVTPNKTATEINKTDKPVKTQPKTQPVVTQAPPKPKAVLGRTVGGNGNGGNGADTYKPGSGEGIAGGQGDQGRPGGVPGGKVYTGTPKNFGVRVLQISNQSFEDEFNENAKIAMEVSADASGKVTSAVYQAKGSTTSHQGMIDIARRKAFQLKLGSSDAGQKGTVIFNFKLKS